MRKNYKDPQTSALEAADRRGVSRVVAQHKSAKSTKSHDELMAFIFGAPKAVVVKSTTPVTPTVTTKAGKVNKALSPVTDFEARVVAGLSNRLEGVDYQAKMVDGVMNKICLCCNEPKEVTYFANLSRAKDGKLNNCKVCEKRRKAK